jgi:hypothetical protein
MAEVDHAFLRKMIGDELDRRESRAYSGGNGGNGHMEARVAKLEALAESTDRRIGAVESDVRQVLWVVIGGFALTLAALAGGFIVLTQKIDAHFLALLDKI